MTSITLQDKEFAIKRIADCFTASAWGPRPIDWRNMQNAAESDGIPPGPGVMVFLLAQQLGLNPLSLTVEQVRGAMRFAGVDFVED